jgi:hypothetical protein
MYNEDFVPQPIQIYKRFEDITANRPHCEGVDNIFTITLPWRITGLSQKQILVHPMLIKRAKTGDPITTFELRQFLGDVLEKDLVSANEALEDLNPDTTDDKEAVIIPVGWFNVNNTFRPGQLFYFKISDGTTTWYSEAVTFVHADTVNDSFPEPCGNQRWMLLGWSNPDCIIGEKYPTSAPSIQFYLQAELGQPEYDYRKDTEEGGQGEEVILFQRLEKRWKLKFTAPEYIVDALQAAQLFSNFALDFADGTGIAATNVQVTQEWIADCYADITMTFAIDFIPKTACC